MDFDDMIKVARKVKQRRKKREEHLEERRAKIKLLAEEYELSESEIEMAIEGREELCLVGKMVLAAIGIVTITVAILSLLIGLTEGAI